MSGPDTKFKFDDAFANVPFMAVLRGYGPSETVQLAERAWDVGITHVEVPIESESALPSLIAAIDAGHDRGNVVGAGTIVTEEQLHAARSAGAAYGVSPGLDVTLLKDAEDAQFPFLPGVSTASEIISAQRLGLRWVKAFPANLLTPAWFSAMRGPFPNIQFVATGGMNAHNASAYLDAGVRVVGVSSALADDAQLEILRSLISQRADKHTPQTLP